MTADSVQQIVANAMKEVVAQMMTTMHMAKPVPPFPVDETPEPVSDLAQAFDETLEAFEALLLGLGFLQCVVFRIPAPALMPSKKVEKNKEPETPVKKSKKSKREEQNVSSPSKIQRGRACSK